MYNKKLTSIAIAVIVLCSEAFGSYDDNTLENYLPGLYVGVLAGYPRTNISNEYLATGYQLKKRGTFAGKLFFGWGFCPYFAIDTGYTYYAGNKIANANTNDEMKFAIHSIDLMAKIIFPLEKTSSDLAGWSLYGKAGPSLSLANNSAKKLTVANWGIKPSYAIGIGYDFTNDFGIDLSLTKKFIPSLRDMES